MTAAASTGRNITENGVMEDGFDPLEGLTSRQRRGLHQLMHAVERSHTWSWDLPVLIRQRCWLRLDHIRLDQLHRWRPPDARADAPELVHFRQLRAQGLSELEAEQACWQEFGMGHCRQALQRFWESQDDAGQHWTTRHYLELVSRYRRSFETGQPCIPMLVLARNGSKTGHQLHWLPVGTPSMRHTCR